MGRLQHTLQPGPCNLLPLLLLWDSCPPSPLHPPDPPAQCPVCSGEEGELWDSTCGSRAPCHSPELASEHTGGFPLKHAWWGAQPPSRCFRPWLSPYVCCLIYPCSETRTLPVLWVPHALQWVVKVGVQDHSLWLTTCACNDCRF